MRSGAIDGSGGTLNREQAAAVIAQAYPEVGAGGYTRMDGSVEFYSRIQALLRPDMRVLDFGAGRAEWFEDDHCEYRRNVRQIRGKVRELVACDVDDAVLTNRTADRTLVISAEDSLPFGDEYFNMIVADYVFEHIREPQSVSRELTRVLAPGGWMCARTPNSLGYVAAISRLVANRFHAPLLGLVQPTRKSIDVFPTVYRLNTLSAIKRHFDPALFDNFTYRYDAEPSYFFGSGALLNVLRFVQWLLPPMFASQLFIFLRKRR
jgi:ubiquinone/menaquinone biosynthesis C-methylase UbiE